MVTASSPKLQKNEGKDQKMHRHGLSGDDIVFKSSNSSFRFNILGQMGQRELLNVRHGRVLFHGEFIIFLCSFNSLNTSVWQNKWEHLRAHYCPVHEPICQSCEQNTLWTRLNNMDDEIMSSIYYSVLDPSCVKCWLLLCCRCSCNTLNTLRLLIESNPSWQGKTEIAQDVKAVTSI